MPSVKKFRAKVWKHYRTHGRDLPWRCTRDPYKILVSEIMLQQTQVERVKKYYGRFLKTFPNWQALARANLREVLKEWQGLGYNRRALALKRVAGIVTARYGGKVPEDFETLRTFPGIGHATAGAVSAFAFQQSVPFIETNIRRVFIHFFFSRRRKVDEREIMKFVEATIDRKNPREWYYALMDYGATLRQAQGKCWQNPNRRSAYYRRQSPFRGSNREVRGKVLRFLIKGGSFAVEKIARRLDITLEQAKKTLSELKREGFLS